MCPVPLTNSVAKNISAISRKIAFDAIIGSGILIRTVKE